MPNELGRVLRGLQQQQQVQQQSWERLLLATLDMSQDELRAALKAAAPAQRFAAALAVGEKRLPWTKELIEMLTDPNSAIRQASRRSLVILSFLTLNPEEAALLASPNPSRSPKPLSQLKRPVDFGPSPAAGPAAQALAAEKWTAWWDKQMSSPAQLVSLGSTKEAALADSEGGRLAATLLAADNPKQQKLLQEYRDTKGGQFTDALALAAVQATGDLRLDLREAFAERMTRMTEATLGRYLHDESAEVRRAAVLGLAMRESKAHLSRMIDLLDDPEPTVGRAAYAALCRLSSKDFGPKLNATQEERDDAISRWRAWAQDP